MRCHTCVPLSYRSSTSTGTSSTECEHIDSPSTQTQRPLRTKAHNLNALAARASVPMENLQEQSYAEPRGPFEQCMCFAFCLLGARLLFCVKKTLLLSDSKDLVLLSSSYCGSSCLEPVTCRLGGENRKILCIVIMGFGSSPSVSKSILPQEESDMIICACRQAIAHDVFLARAHIGVK